MVSNIGKITNLAGTPSTGLVDGSDKLHSGILKVLESFSQGDMCISHAGFTITGAGSHTQYNLAQPIKFLKKGELVTHTVTLVEPYTGTTQNASHTRYDWVLINPATPELVIVQGTAASTPTVADITAGFIPIALVEITTTDPLDNDKTDYSFQTYTMNVVKNSLSIGYDDSGYTEALSITASAGDTTIENKVSDKDIIFKVKDGSSAGTESMRIDADINQVKIKSLGIGTAAELTITESSDNVTIKNTVADKDIIFNINDSDGGGDTEVMRIDGSTSRVGIGATTPTAKLEVAGDVDISRSSDSGQTRTLSIEGARNAAGTDYARIDLENYDSHGPTSYVGARISAVNDADGVDDGSLVLSTANAGTLAERMRIKDSGEVVIGTDLQLSTSSDHAIIENVTQDKDIIFKVNDGGVIREMLRLDADDNEVRIVSTIDSTGIGPQLTLFRDTPDASDNDNIGVISLKGEDSLNAETEYVRIQGQILDETDTEEDAQLFIRTLKAGSLAYNLKFTPTQTIFNANNDDIDIRIDGATDYLFYADSSANKIGIGTNTPDAPLHVVSTDDGETLRLESTDSGAGLAPDLIFKRTSTSPATGDNLGNIRFLGTNINDTGSGVSGDDGSQKAEHEFADIYARANDVTLGTEDGELYFRTFVAGTQRRRLDLTPTETAFNEDAQDINFRAEGVGQTHALFVQGSDGKVGIRNGSPSAVLDVTGSIASSTTITATTSVTSAAIVGNTSVTGAIVTSNAEMVTNGLRKTALEAVDVNHTPQPSWQFPVIYVGDISTIAAGPLVNNQIDLPPATDKVEYKIINIHAANAITIIVAGGSGDVINNNQVTHPYITAPSVITLQPSQGVHLQGVTADGVQFVPLQRGWFITGVA